ncbi:hypothetical protein [Nioella nitratireducens]|uniref:hypothetical protein n=1 Tax=Nioella nitratireducens TaxID=1287720 RepID=UPI001314CBB6|nr:hypothetical protein [Nioella nitratireducens]
MYRFSLALFVSLLSTAQLAAEPGFGTSIGPDGDMLQYSCIPSEAGVRCEFVQILMSAMADESDLAQELSNIDAMLEQISEEFAAGDEMGDTCNLLMSLVPLIEQLRLGNREEAEALASQIGVESGNENDIEAMWTDFLEMDHREFEDSSNVMTALVDLCAGVTRGRVEALIRAQHQQRSQTCRPFINSWEAEFSRVSENLWAITRDEPYGECAVVRLDRFICDDEHSSLCSFISEKRVLNPDGEILGGLVGNCSQLDQRELVYDWRDRIHYLPCDRVDF